MPGPSCLQYQTIIPPIMCYCKPMHLDRFIIGSMNVLSRLAPLMILVVMMKNLQGRGIWSSVG